MEVVSTMMTLLILKVVLILVLNYNPKATKDDGSCKYDNTTPTKTQKFYVWSEKGSIKYKLNGTLIYFQVLNLICLR